MNADVLPVPGIVLGAYPERRGATRGRASDMVSWVQDVLSRPERRHRYRGFAEYVARLDAKLDSLDADAITKRLLELRAALARHGMAEHNVALAFALIKRVCKLELGIDLFPTQLVAARIMLDKQLAEMATGEGKTLAAAVCAATAALAGIPVHVITANDYLVGRDAESLRPLYDALRLRVGVVTRSVGREARRLAYQSDIVYCTASELVFDYLRDGLIRGRLRSDLGRRVATLGDAASEDRVLLRGLCMAIVDEADSVLIDEARVPLVLSERSSNEGERSYLGHALDLSVQLRAGTDYVLYRERMSVDLTAEGRRHLEQLASTFTGAWRNRLHREETVSTALAAVHLYQRDRHYLVRDGVVSIIDQCTGRVASGRVWSLGLHQLIELKEGCRPSSDTTTVAQITYQRFFRRYLALSGMSGTLHEARKELRVTYGLHVVKVPLCHGDRRKRLSTRFYPNRDAQWRAVLDHAGQLSSDGRPVLIGTDSVAESEELARCLTQAGLAHAVLNARQDREEARVIANAGKRGQITVATNMAGRGTDIALGAGVAQLGGLHVICCQHDASRRIERQLIGRCARRGDPGSAQTLLSLDKPFIARFVPRWMAHVMSERGFERPQWLVRFLVNAPQRLEERRQRAQREDLLRRDVRADQSMAFGRPLE